MEYKGFWPSREPPRGRFGILSIPKEIPLGPFGFLWIPKDIPLGPFGFIAVAKVNRISARALKPMEYNCFWRSRGPPRRPFGLLWMPKEGLLGQFGFLWIPKEIPWDNLDSLGLPQ